jgi:hypothetical protein
MTEHVAQPNDELKGWRQAVEDTSQHPELHAIAKSHLERVESKLEISPEHHQSHIDIVRPAVPNIDSLPADEQDFFGELVEIGQEALEDAEIAVASPSETYTDPEKLNKRISEALASCEVETTPEVHEAIKGFYEDHYSFAEVIRKAIDGTLTSEECDTILDKNVGTIIAPEDVDGYVEPPRTGRYASAELPSVNHAVTLLAAVAKEQLTKTGIDSANNLRKATLIHALLLMEQLFNESSLPVITIGEEETQIINNLFDQIAIVSTSKFSDASLNGDTLQWNNGVTYASSESKQALISRVEQTRNEFWNDTRMAGQLVYHNTGHLDGVSISGGLMSRLQQKRELGEMRTTTPDANAGQLHHSVVPHFSEEYSPSAYKVGIGERDSFTSRGTVAIPLINVIEAAPFARDAEYATVTARTLETLGKVPVHDTIGEPSTDTQDYPGRDGGDRVFFASPTQHGDKLPDEYVIKLNGSRPPATRNTLIFFGDKEIATSPEYGLGERFADRLHIQDESRASELIKELQQRYIRLNQGKIIVPLRRGVFDFMPEGMEWAPRYRAPQAQSYRLE